MCADTKKETHPLLLSVGVLALLTVGEASGASYLDDVGFTRLASELGAAAPAGNGVAVGQVEASTVGSPESPDYPVFAPDTTASQLAGRVFAFPGTNGSGTAPSGHATSVAGRFYGNDAMASGVTHISAWLANDWLGPDLLDTYGSGSPVVPAARVTNHSWVGTEFDDVDNGPSGTELTSDALRRVDWLVETHDAIQVVGMNNGTVNQPLLGSTYNAIAVGRTDGIHAQGTVALDAVYTAGRQRPDLVAPLSATSGATPVVASAAALLVEIGHAAQEGQGTSDGQGGLIYDGERSEVVRAALMAGADRVTYNTSTTADITDYRSAGHATDNGLDDRLGAGQLNVYTSHSIIAAGQQDSLEDGGPARVNWAGYDYDPSFGDQSGTVALGSYLFETATEDLRLGASLVWNIDIDTGGPGFDTEAMLYDLDLFLYDVTGGGDLLVGSSASSTESTENLWLDLLSGRDYQLRVLADAGQSLFDWDYALAWTAAPVPLPASLWMLLSGVAVLAGFKRSKT